MANEDNDAITRRELEARFQTVQVQFDSQKVAVKAALDAADRATTKSETAMEKRFDNTNEWRGTVEGLQRSYLPRQEFEAVKLAYDERINALKEQVTINTGRGKGMGEMLATILSIVAMFAAVGALVTEVIKR